MMSTQPPESREVLRQRLETTLPPGGQLSAAVDTDALVAKIKEITG